MKKLSTRQYDLVRPLFSDAPHNHPVLHSVLDHRQPGTVFASDETTPAFAIVALEDMLFFAGNPKTALNGEMIRRLLHESLFTGEIPYYELHPLCTDWYPLLEEAFPDEVCVRRTRKTFSISRERLRKTIDVSPPLSAQYRCCGITAQLFNQLPMPPAFWAPSTGRFGVAVLKQEAIVSHCFAVFVGGNMAEVSVDTHEAHRREGLALHCATAFFRECLARGLHPNWACWEERTASAALAKKLGFVETHRHEALVIKA